MHQRGGDDENDCDLCKSIHMAACSNEFESASRWVFLEKKKESF